MIEIKNRYDGQTICSGDSVRDAAVANRANLYRANLYRANLYRANLSGADLSWANLSGADLYRANLSGADLSGADLSWANLSWADLSWANLSGADLCRANLSWANLSWANLSNIKVSWQSHDLLAEILKRAACGDTDKLKVAGLVLVCRDRCWADFLLLGDPLTDWALDTLVGWCQDGDGAPDCIRQRAAA